MLDIAVFLIILVVIFGVPAFMIVAFAKFITKGNDKFFGEGLDKIHQINRESLKRVNGN